MARGPRKLHPEPFFWAAGVVPRQLGTAAALQEGSLLSGISENGSRRGHRHGGLSFPGTERGARRTGYSPAWILVQFVKNRVVAVLKDQVKLPLPPEDLQEVDQVGVLQLLKSTRSGGDRDRRTTASQMDLYAQRAFDNETKSSGCYAEGPHPLFTRNEAFTQ